MADNVDIAPIISGCPPAGSKISPAICTVTCLPPEASVYCLSDRGPGGGQEGGVDVDLARAVIPVPGDHRVAGPARIAAEAGQGQLARLPEQADLPAGLRDVVQCAGLGMQRILYRVFLCGQAGRGSALAVDEGLALASAQEHLYLLGCRVRQVSLDPVQ